MKRWIIRSFFIGLLLLCAGGCRHCGERPGMKFTNDPEKIYDQLPPDSRELADQILSLYSRAKTADELESDLKKRDFLFGESGGSRDGQGQLHIVLRPLYSLVFIFDAPTRRIQYYYFTVNWG